MSELYIAGDVFYPMIQEPHDEVSSMVLMVLRDDGFWNDFDDDTFKNSGWTDVDQTLTEDDNGIWINTTGFTLPSGTRSYRAYYKDNDGNIQEGERFRVGAVDVGAISGDATAADNLELQYDTTGLTGDTFPATQQQLGNIALTGAAVATPAKDAPNGFVITSGENEANDEDSTHALDGVTHDIEAVNDGGTEKIEVYYEFTIGGDGVPTGIIAHHQFDKGGGAAKNLTIWAYNWDATTWDQIGTLNSGTSLETDPYTLFTSHVGTGGDLGLVRFRYLTGGVPLSATSKLLVDQVFVEYAIVSRTVGYADGAIWVDTNGSNTNTESYIDGTADNPVSTWAAALTLSGQLNITRFRVINGSAITLTGNSDNYSIIGQEYTLAFGGQSTAALYVFGGSVSGTGTGSVLLEDCPVGDVTLPPSIMRRCFIFGTITNSGVGDWFINDPRSRVAGAGSPVFDFGTAVGNTNLNIRGNSGGWQLEAMGDTGTDTASIEGWGQVIEGTCTGGTVVVRGNLTVSGITNLTLSDDARLTRSELVDDLLDEVNSKAAHNVPGSLGKQIREAGVIIAAEGAVIGTPTTTIFVTNITGFDDNFFVDQVVAAYNGAVMAGQGRVVSAYNGTTGEFTVDEAFTSALDPGDDVIIFTPHVHDVTSIQAGLALEATLTAMKGATFSGATDSLEAIRNRGDAAWTTGAGGSSPTVQEIVDGLFAEVVDATMTYQEVITVMLSALAGKSSGGGTATLIFRDEGDTKARITATVDANGNRTAITLDGA